MLVLVIMATLIISGILHSRTIFSFMHFSGGMILRKIHTFAAYWGLVLVSIHIWIHWDTIITIIMRMMKSIGIIHVKTVILRCISLVIIIYGISSFFERDMLHKLFLGYSFDFWDTNKNSMVFFANNLSIMGIYIAITYYSIKIIKFLRIKVIGNKFL
jgi:hypothetical protein